jgi:hypothetical protein
MCRKTHADNAEQIHVGLGRPRKLPGFADEQTLKKFLDEYANIIEDDAE